MVFSGNVFLFLFLPTVLLVYYFAPKKLRNTVLLLFSLAFYGFGEWRYLPLMLLVIGFTYLGGLGVARFRAPWLVGITVTGCLLCLGYFKYSPLLPGMWAVALPMGISFYIFHCISYVVDVYRGRAAVQKNILTFATYITLFPRLIAGPIVRYADIAQQMKSRRENWADVSDGIQLFLVGLGKKLLLANPMGQIWQQLQAFEGTAAAWLGLVCYSLQIYFDFSGYSDMARGLGLMFGFSFLKNFDYPYISCSITEFWRRWHISLSTWFREYVYIPLGGNQQGWGRQIRNLLIVWSLTGLWHGAGWNFLLWGLYYGLLLVLEKRLPSVYLTKLPKLLRRGGTLLLVMLGWAIFYFEDMGALREFFRRLFVYSPMASWQIPQLWRCLPWLVVGVVAATPIPKYLLYRCRLRWWMQLLRWLVGLGILLLSVSALAGQSYNPFLYFRF